MISGNVARLFVNTRPLAFDTVDVEGMADLLRVTNSEGLPANAAGAVSGFHTNLSGCAVLQLTVNSPTFDTSLNPFATPFIIIEGALIVLQLYPAGLGGVSWYSPSFRVARVGQRIQAAGLQPVYFSGESSGLWSNPAA
jgi:hypothetical protein